MKKIFLIIYSLMSTVLGFAQKPAVTPEIAQSWGRVSWEHLSNNGKYFLYQINAYSRSKNDKLVISSTTTTWKKELREFKDYVFKFTADSRIALGFEKGDSLLLVTLGTDKTEYICGVGSFKIPESGRGHWLAYQLKDSLSGLVLRDLNSHEEWRLGKVNEYQFFEDGSALILSKITAEGKKALIYIDLNGKMKEQLIWEGESTSSLIFDKTLTKLIFGTSEIIDGKKTNAIWCYRKGQNEAIKIVDDHANGIGDGYKIGKLDGFTANGLGIIFCRERAKAVLAKPVGVSVDVWSYTDAKLQSNQLWKLKSTDPFFNPEPKYRALANLENGKIIPLEQGDESIIGEIGNYALVYTTGNGDTNGEWNWNRTAHSAVDLIDIRKGIRKGVLSNISKDAYANNILLSPDETYVFYFNPKKQNYFSYHIATGSIKCLTENIVADWTSYSHRDEPDADYRPIRYEGFMNGGKDVLICSRNDLFQVDLSGKIPPVNLTNNYGKRNNISFGLTGAGGDLKPGDKLVLNAFDRKNNNNGFYSIIVGKKADPVMLSMQPCIFVGPTEVGLGAHFMKEPVIKAKDADVYLVWHQKASESRNLLLTKDFKEFIPVSNNYPEKAYNWLTSELHTWKGLNGDAIKGILYKPENFDPTKKYPIVFHYYEKLSETLHVFTKPEYSNGVLDIPYYVNNDYLVFVPDIPKIMGHPGPSAVNSVVSAAEYLSKFSWVDSLKMGIMGHSFGGFETNYIITHSNKFAAAVPAASMSDFISCYGSILWLGDGSSRQKQYEVYHDAIGASMWERPDLYIENSPVLYAHKVTTPVLMMHNKGDGDVPFAQGVEFFTALRRLGKRAWMLQYDGEDHALYDKEEARKDFTIRTLQFFDHYLKGKPAPVWMTRGIPAKDKGIKDGLEYDTEIKTPIEGGLLLPEEKQKVNAFKNRKPFTITIP